MTMKAAKIRGTHPYTFRCGEWANIIAVKIGTPGALESRPCFIIEFEDGEIDSIPVYDQENYEIAAGKV